MYKQPTWGLLTQYVPAAVHLETVGGIGPHFKIAFKLQSPWLAVSELLYCQGPLDAKAFTKEPLQSLLIEAKPLLP